MRTSRDLIPVTIYLPEEDLATIATIANKRGRRAQAEIQLLVKRALSIRRYAPHTPGSAAMRAFPSFRTRDSLNDGDAMNMLSMLFLGVTVEEIAAKFNMAIHDAEAHLAYLKSTNPRSKHSADAGVLRRAS